ncbi:integrase [Mesorhizobium huakuii]|nr:integrase [Mesorhizobium huakuii]
MGAQGMENRSYSTDRELKALRPADNWYDVKDEKTRNLMVRVGPKNEKGEFRRTFVMVTRFPGSKHPTRHAFGEYRESGKGDLTLEEARERTDEWRKLIKQNVDPREAQRKAKEDAERKRDLRFGIVVEDFISEKLKKQRRGKVVEYELRKEVLPLWKDRPITDVTDDDVKALIKGLTKQGKLAHAHNVLTDIRSFFNWAINQPYGLKASPCDRLKPKALIGEKKPRQRVLADVELAALWRATARLGYPYGPLFRLLAVTGQRKSEVGEGQWSEFHPDLVRLLRSRQPGDAPIDWGKLEKSTKVWTIPPERFKSDASHMVPLTDDALSIIETLPHWIGKHTGDYLFSTTAGVLPVNGFSKAKERLDARILRTLKAIARKRGDDPKKVTLPDFVLHDIRRTVRTRLSSLRIPTEIAEMVIGHARKGIARVYDQHQFADEMREAHELWAGKLRSIVNPPPANVISLRSSRNG